MISLSILGTSIAGIGFGIFMIYLTILRFRRKELTPRAFLIFMTVWLGFIFMSFFPGILDPFLDLIHFKRRLDLFIILGFMFLITLVFYTHSMTTILNKKMEQLTRTLAFMKADEKQDFEKPQGGKMKKRALITGITGQDGSYLAEFLLEKGYEVHGIIRRTSTMNTGRIDHLHNPEENKENKIFLHYGDLSDTPSLFDLIKKIKPDEIYNLAAQSHVGISFKQPEYTTEVTGVGVIRLLEAVRASNPKIKVYQASSSEMFGKARETPQTENTPFHPRSPYGCAKVLAYWIIRNYREAYGMFTVNGILFNHESPRRGRNFVTRKISRNLAEIKLGKKDMLFLGNMDAKRDWGYAKDYVEAMWLMMQQEKPEDYVVATGETHTVREFVEVCAEELGFDIEWRGEGTDEVGVDKSTGKTIIAVDPEYFRPAEVELLKGDASKIKAIGWEPKTTFKDLAKLMVKEDMEMLKNDDERY